MAAVEKSCESHFRFSAALKKTAGLLKSLPNEAHVAAVRSKSDVTQREG